MSLSYQLNDAARSLDQQQKLDWIEGWQVVDPAGGSNAVSVGTGDFEYDVAGGDVNLGGTVSNEASGSVDFENDIDPNDAQMAVIYRDANGDIQKKIGSTGTATPSGDDARSTHTPAPPSMHDTDGVVLAEVLLPAGATSLGSDQFRDRRMTAELVLDSLDGDFLTEPLTNFEGDGLKMSSGALTTEPNDFAGTGLEDDGSDNLRIASSAAGNGLTGGSGSALAIATDGIGTDELDLTIAPTWTGEHTFSGGLNIPDDTDLEFGANGDFSISYASTPDEWRLRDKQGNEDLFIINGTDIVVGDTGGTREFRIQVGNNEAFTVDQDGHIGIGAAPEADIGIKVDSPAETLTANASYSQFEIENTNTLTVQGSTTSPRVDMVEIEPPNISLGGGASVTTAATLALRGAPTAGDDNYALWISDGNVSLKANDAELLFGANDEYGLRYTGTAFQLQDNSAGDTLISMDANDITLGDTRNIRITYGGGTNALEARNSDGHIALGGAVLDEQQLVLDAPAETVDTLDQFHRVDIKTTNAVTFENSTSPEVASLQVAEPNITIGTGGGVTTAATVVIPTAPTEGVNNYAILTKEGDVALQEDDAELLFGAGDDYALRYNGSALEFVDKANADVEAKFITGGGIEFTNHTIEMKLDEGEDILKITNADSSDDARFTWSSGNLFDFNVRDSSVPTTRSVWTVNPDDGILNFHQNVDFEADLNFQGNIDLEGTGADTVVTLDSTFDLIVEDDDGTDRFAVREGGPTEVVAGDLRIPTDGDIEDGGGSPRFRLGATGTTIYFEDGDPAIQAFASSSLQFDAYSTEPIRIFDNQGSFEAFKYTTGASAGAGTLTVDAELDLTGNGLANVNNIEVEDRDADGILKYRVWESSSSGDFQLQTRNQSDNTFRQNILNANESYVEVANGDLRIPTGNSIEDGSGTNRATFTSNETALFDENGDKVLESFGGLYSALIARSDRDMRIWDDEGSFYPLSYSTSASAPGTLTLDADTFVKDGAGLVVGSSVSRNVGGTFGEIQMLGTGSPDTKAQIARYSNNAEAGSLFFAKSRNATIAAGTAVASGDELGTLRFFGDDGTDLTTEAAQIIVDVDGTVATDQIPGRIEFKTAGSAGNLAEALRINSSQQILAAQDGSAGTPAIAFGDDTDTGMYLNTTGIIGFSTGGTAAMTISNNVNIVNTLNMSGGSIVNVGGTTDASAGDIRAATGFQLRARNAGDTADLILLEADGSDNVKIGGLANATSLLVENIPIRIQNGSGTALPGTSLDGQIRVFDDTDEGDPSGRIQFQANSTTFTVNADAGIWWADHEAYAEAYNNLDPLGGDETRCAVTGQKLGVDDPVALMVDKTKQTAGPAGYYDEIHTVPVTLDAALEESERVQKLEDRIDRLESELADLKNQPAS